MDGTRERIRLRRSIDQSGTQDLPRFFRHGVAVLGRTHAQTSRDPVVEVVDRDAGHLLSPRFEDAP